MKVLTKKTIEKKMRIVAVKQKINEVTVIKTTEDDIKLSVQTVTPSINYGKMSRVLEKEFCLLIEGEIYNSSGDTEILCEPVFLGKEGAKQLLKELKKFIKIPF
jgi:hypothetical protein